MNSALDKIKKLAKRKKLFKSEKKLQYDFQSKNNHPTIANEDPIELLDSDSEPEKYQEKNTKLNASYEHKKKNVNNSEENSDWLTTKIEKNTKFNNSIAKKYRESESGDELESENEPESTDESESQSELDGELDKAIVEVGVSSSDGESEDDEDDGKIGQTLYEKWEGKSEKHGKRREEVKHDNIVEIKGKEAADQSARLEDKEFFDFPTKEILEKEKELGVDFDIVKNRYENVIQILANWKQHQDPKHAKKEYIELLKNDVSYYYGYNSFLIDRLFSLFGPNQAIEFIQSNEGNRPVTIRVNSLKTRRKDLMNTLANRGVSLEEIKWCKYGLQVFESSVPIAATPEYLSGHYMLQSASSMTSIMALDPQPEERILDMCSAPGGKTTFIGQLMKNTGTLISNDINSARLASLSGNIHRLGLINTIITNYDALEIPNLMSGFDRVLLDAPCSGTGIISRDVSVKISKNQDDLNRLSHIQRKLLLAAIDCTDARSPSGGIIVYSTCSILAEENEAVINYALKKRYIKIVDTKLELGLAGLTHINGKVYNESLKLARRFYPHVYNMDGFFVCRIRKLKNGIRKDSEEESETVKKNNEDAQKVKNKRRPKNDGDEFVEITDDEPTDLKKKKF